MTTSPAKPLSLIRVYHPKNLTALLILYQKNPQALICGGGTDLFRRRDWFFGKEMAPGAYREVISLGQIQELNHISRTESYIEVGAAVPISQILGIGRHILAPAFFTALNQLGTVAIRNMASLGGNLAQPERWLSLVPVFLLLDVRLELRRQNAGEWVPISKFLERHPLFRPGELLTRIRIPLEEWNVQHFRIYKTHVFGPGNELSWCALAQVEKGYLERFRMAVGAPDNLIIRNREMENTIAGKKLPINLRELEPLKEQLQQTLENVQPRLSPIQQQLMTRTTYWFLLRYLADLWEDLS
jgi:CO/xanthine dehydrogenase FAD-binding subunit